MRDAIDNGLLLNDLDAKGFSILNCMELQADNVISIDDPRLYDKRAPIDGSVTNESVSRYARIAQSKLSLNGSLPPEWLGDTEEEAAQGDLVERVSAKNAANGYAGLGSGGKMISGSVPLSGTGTVKLVLFVFPPELIAVSPGVMAWASAPPHSMLSMTDDSPVPVFRKTPFPMGSIPNIGAAKIASGMFSFERLPADKLLPAPGDGSEGHISDYYSRNGKWLPMAALPIYQPTLSGPSITLLLFDGSSAMLNVTSSRSGVILFANTSPDSPDTFIEITKQPVAVPQGYKFKAYAAKSGWNNSDIVSYEVPLGPLEEFEVTTPPI